ncbi:MAG: ABC transporter ATP-binding protein [Gammaproteobacteria bacterium]|nr:ABC transporter ATP-binding protein [Gammaproteobacteria bacterium]
MNYAYHLREIEFAYDATPAIALDEYYIQQQSITALVGANGSGKSTLMNILAFINRPSRGNISFFGEQVRDDDYLSLRRRTAYIQQKPYLLNTTVYRNIELGLKLRAVKKVQRHARVAEVIEQLGIQHLSHRRAHELSGGEAQKVAIARAIVLDPQVLILDEPFSHLDEKFKHELEELIRKLNKVGKLTIIFSTHDKLQAQSLADQICSLVDGHVVPSSIINLFPGSVDVENGLFVTENSVIHLPASITSGTRLGIDSTEIVLSRDELKSSMRNRFYGKIKSLHDEAGDIHVIVNAGEKFHAIITKAALDELAVSVGDDVWVSFKSSVVNVYL